MKYYWGPGKIQDGKLDDNCGRIVIFEDKAVVSYIKTADHNYLLRSLASKYKFDKDEVISKAIRLYFRWDEDMTIICGVRKIDNDMIEHDYDFYRHIIKKALK